MTKKRVWRAGSPAVFPEQEPHLKDSMLLLMVNLSAGDAAHYGGFVSKFPEVHTLYCHSMEEALELMQKVTPDAAIVYAETMARALWFLRLMSEALEVPQRFIPDCHILMDEYDPDSGRELFRNAGLPLRREEDLSFFMRDLLSLGLHTSDGYFNELAPLTDTDHVAIFRDVLAEAGFALVDEALFFDVILSAMKLARRMDGDEAAMRKAIGERDLTWEEFWRRALPAGDYPYSIEEVFGIIWGNIQPEKVVREKAVPGSAILHRFLGRLEGDGYPRFLLPEMGNRTCRAFARVRGKD